MNSKTKSKIKLVVGRILMAIPFLMMLIIQTTITTVRIIVDYMHYGFEIQYYNKETNTTTIGSVYELLKNNIELKEKVVNIEVPNKQYHEFDRCIKMMELGFKVTGHGFHSDKYFYYSHKQIFEMSNENWENFKPDGFPF